MKTTLDFRQGIKFEVGSGTRIRFWKDRWCTDRPLMLGSPSISAFRATRMLRSQIVGFL